MPADVPDWKQVHRRATVVDVHAHPSLQIALFHQNLARRYRVATTYFWPSSVRTGFLSLEKGGVDVLMSAVYAPEKPILDDLPLLKLLRFVPFPSVRRTWNAYIKPSYAQAATNAINELEKQAEQFRQQVQKLNADRPSERRRPVAIARSLPDLERILVQGEDGPIAIVHTLEGAHNLEGDSGSVADILANLEVFSTRGVASITLAHFYPNKIVAPCFPYPDYALTLLSRKRRERIWWNFDLTRGLTPAGEQVVEKMLDLGILIDVSHCTPTARRRIYEIAGLRQKRAAILATHVGAYTINPSPYNLEDWEIRWIADQGGVIGVIFMNYWLLPHDTPLGVNAISRTIEHLASAAGGRTDHIAIGTDFDGFTDPPDDLKEASDLPRLTMRLMAEFRSVSERKYSDDEVQNIMGGNALRMLREGWGRK